MFKLRDYQHEARWQVNTLLNHKRNPCLVIPTGGGKTKTAAVIIEDQIRLGKKVWALTPQEEIFNQWLADTHFLKPGYINQNGVVGSNRSLYICMPLSLVNLLPWLPESFKPDIIITDECHHSAADSWEKIYRHFPNALRLGLTATPRRTDNKGLAHIYSDIVQTTTMKELIKNGFLAKPLPIVPEQYLDDVSIKIKQGDFDPEEQAKLLGKKKIIGDVIAKYSNVFGGLPVLVACSSYHHAEQMTKEFSQVGWKFSHIHSNLSRGDRARMLREISTGKINGLCTVGIGTEGLDIPGLYGLIWLRRTLSLTVYLQFNGRVLRPLEGKTHGVIIDPVGNTFIHGLPDNERKWSLENTILEPEYEKNENQIKMILCSSCGVMNSKENEYCHFCGSDLKLKSIKKRTLAIVEGELTTIDKSDIPILNKRSKIEIERNKKQSKENTRETKVTNRDKENMIKRSIFGSKRSLFNEAVRKFI